MTDEAPIRRQDGFHRRCNALDERSDWRDPSFDRLLAIIREDGASLRAIIREDGAATRRHMDVVAARLMAELKVIMDRIFPK